MDFKNTCDVKSLSYKIHVDDPKLSFSAAHFLAQHPTCGCIHGHNYSVEITVSSTKGLNEDYMIIDFHDIKKITMEIIKDLDHKLLVPAKSSRLSINEEDSNLSIQVKATGKKYSIPIEDVCLLPIPETTAECLAEFIYNAMKKKTQSMTIQVLINENIGSHAIYGD